MNSPMSSELCPRCQIRRYTTYNARGVSNEEVVRHPYPALSRVADIYICSDCGRDEAMRDFQALPPVPPDEWPVRPPLGSYGQGATTPEGS